jgi:hypothetical protein
MPVWDLTSIDAFNLIKLTQKNPLFFALILRDFFYSFVKEFRELQHFVYFLVSSLFV